MYNDRMPNTSYEIRQCGSCGLRYPLIQGHPFGTRCPACLGDTRLVLSWQLVAEPGPTRPAGTLPKSNKKNSTYNPIPNAGFGEGRGRAIAVLLDNIRS